MGGKDPHFVLVKILDRLRQVVMMMQPPFLVKVYTINNESLEWLKLGGFGELIKFAKLSSANLL